MSSLIGGFSLGVPGRGTGMQLVVVQFVPLEIEWVMSRGAVGGGKRRCLVDVRAAAEMMMMMLELFYTRL